MRYAGRQGKLAIAVLVAFAGLITGCGSHPGLQASGRVSATSSPAGTSPAYLHPQGKVTNASPEVVLAAPSGPAHGKATQPADEPWLQLLPPTPPTWTVLAGPSPVTAAMIAATFARPARVRIDLRSYDYQRGISRDIADDSMSVHENLWQFDSVNDAFAWFDEVVTGNEQATSVFPHTFQIAGGGYGFLSSVADSNGKYRGLGVTASGDIVVIVEVDGQTPVTESVLQSQLAIATGPVARGIRPA